jgi:hypothetical protein
MRKVKKKVKKKKTVRPTMKILICQETIWLFKWEKQVNMETKSILVTLDLRTAV